MDVLEKPKEFRYLERGDRLIATNGWGIWILTITEVKKISNEDFILTTCKFTGMEDAKVTEFTTHLGVSGKYHHYCSIDGNEFDFFTGIEPFKEHCKSLISSVQYNLKRIDELW